MHMKETPMTMQINPKYGKVTEEIADFFKERLSCWIKKNQPATDYD